MPANHKSFPGLKRDSYERVRQQLASKRMSLPSGDSGYLRGSNGMIADWNYDEKSGEFSIRVRSPGDGETYESVFSSLENIVKVSSTS